MLNSVFKKTLVGLINQKLADAGRVESLEFDPQLGVVELYLNLVGEDEIVSVTVMGVLMSETGQVSFQTASSNRLWIQALLNTYAHRLVLTVPAKYLPVVRMFFARV